LVIICSMTTEVLVTRRGQTTIPIEIRRKLRIREGTKLKVESVGDKIIFTKPPSIDDLDGSSKLSPAEAIRFLDKMREAE
jgi:AbrB family looped-hinge helix DNA binding protein